MPAHEDSDRVAMEQLAAEALVAASALDMQSSDGGAVEVWTLSSEDRLVRATAPRLEVREGIELCADLLLDGLPYTVTTRVAEAGYRSPSRAALALEVTDVSPTGRRRFEERVRVATNVTITAQSCERLMDGDSMETVAVDVSPSGIGLSVLDARVRPGDVFALHVHFIHGEVRERVEVVRTTSFDSGQRIAGCRFVAGSAATNAVIDRVMRRPADEIA